MSTEMHSIPILGLSCGGGGALSVEHVLEKMDGVLRVYVNPATAAAYVTLDPDRILVKDVVRAIQECGYDAGVSDLF